MNFMFYSEGLVSEVAVPHYLETKGSGLDWVGKIPKDWELLPAGGLFSEVKEKNKDKRYCNPFSFRYGQIVDKHISGESDDSIEETLSAYRVVSPNTIMINGLNLNYDFVSQRVAIVREKGIITSAYLAVQPDETRIRPLFAVYLLKAYDYCQVFHGIGSGIRKTLKYQDFKKIGIPLPSLILQDTISAYLDDQCGRIDSLIEEAKASIEEYKTWKASIIFEAVTKGLNPDVAMKGSGVEWIGDIPVHWHFTKITRVLNTEHPYPIGDGDHGLIKPADYKEAGIPYIRVQNLGWCTPLQLDNVVYISAERNEAIKNSTLKPDDILFAKTGATIGKTGMIPQTMPIANTTSHVGKITVSKKYNAKYIFYVLSSLVGFNQFGEVASAKTTRPELAIDEIKAVKITLPPLKSEQDAIAEYLDGVCPTIDQLIAEKTALISDLEAYKKSLIYETVTGKRKVV